MSLSQLYISSDISQHPDHLNHLKASCLLTSSPQSVDAISHRMSRNSFISAVGHLTGDDRRFATPKR